MIMTMPLLHLPKEEYTPKTNEIEANLPREWEHDASHHVAGLRPRLTALHAVLVA
jgi:hypothetical protein